MSKHLAIVIVLVIASVLVAACAAPAPTSTPVPPTAAPSPTSAPKPTAVPATQAPAATAVPATKAPAATAVPPTQAPAATATSSTAAAAEFFKGKTVTIYVGSAAGGYTDILARIVAKDVQEVTGVKFVVQNETGGGGRVILNNIYGQIKNDGLSLLFMPSGSIWPAYMTGDTAATYDITKFQYVGGIEAGNALVSVYPKGKIQTIDDLMKAKGLKFAATNKTTLPTVANTLAMEILGLDGKIITGFDSSTGRQLALQQGDADATVMSSDTTAKGQKDGIMKPLVQVGTSRMKGYEDVPCLTDLKKPETLTENQKKLLASIDLLNDAKTLIAPPGTPQDRVDYLTNAFKQAYDTTAMKAEIKTASGEDAWPFIAGPEVLKQAVALAAKKGDMAVWTDILNKYVQ